MGEVYLHYLEQLEQMAGNRPRLAKGQAGVEARAARNAFITLETVTLLRFQGGLPSLKVRDGQSKRLVFS